MAYLVLALGAFLSIGGAFSIFHGAGIVEVERGWTGVIAGATSLTGGIITIALGLILKTLQDLRPLMAEAAARSARPIDVEHDSIELGHPEVPGAATGAEPTPLMSAELESGMLAAMLAPNEPVEEPIRPFGAPAERPRASSLPVADSFEPIRNDDLVPERPSLGPEPDGEAEVPASRRERPAEKSRFAINFKRQPPASLPPEPVAPEPAPAEVPPMDDWLDRAFSALDNEAPLGPSRIDRHHAPEPAAPVAQSIGHDASHASVMEAPVATHSEPVAAAPEPVVEAPPQQAPATSAVIGRYEADGTAYVMYADGSIEAQSDAGVYRFNSMAELKAFIENATP